MRVIASSPQTPGLSPWPRASVRATNVELLGLLGCTLVVVLGLLLTYLGRVARLAEDAPAPAGIVHLDQLQSPGAIEGLLTMYEQPFERQAIARALYERVVTTERRLDHVGGLAFVTIPASRIQQEPRFVELRSRLARRPEMAYVPVLRSSDLAAIKPRVVVRSAAQFRQRLLAAAGCLIAAFWIAHLVRRWRRADDEPLMLPVLLTLCGIGLMSMIALRDPLRDTVIASGFATGVVVGLAVFLAVTEIDFEASSLRRAVLRPLAIALGLAVLLLAFGTGPGASGAKVNLAGVQPVEAIRLLVILALAAYFARRLDCLRELSEPFSPSRPWLQWIRVPRWKDVRPVLVSMGLVLTFFFLQKDLGPALVMSCVFLALYGIARGRSPFVVLGFALLISGFAVAYALGMPATVRQRVLIWADPWNNGVPGGNQIAHGLWALSTGGPWGLGHGLGSPQVIPAGHTDFVLAVIGEELGFVGVAVVVALYVLLCWRCLRIALRAPGDYTAFLATGVTLALVAQALVIAGGLVGLMPLSGVVTPFLSYGKSSMLANFAALGVVMAIARRKGAVRRHFLQPVRVLGAVLALAAAAVLLRAMWVQIPHADEYATRSSVGEQADGGYRFEYNPRLLAAARQIPRGSIYDRRGLPIATSRPDEIAGLAEAYRAAGVPVPEDCDPAAVRCYPLGGIGFHVVGDWRAQTNWGARNSSYLERDRAARLQGFNDHPQAVDVTNPATGARERAVKRDYRELLPLVRHRYRPSSAAVKALLGRERDIHTTIDAGLQVRASSALRRPIETNGNSRGSAVVLDTETGEVLAAVSYPWPVATNAAEGSMFRVQGSGFAVQGSGFTARGAPPSGLLAAAGIEDTERYFDRTRYGLYPPGSIFKLIVAGAALRTDTSRTFACVRLPDGRVGNYVRGSKRPVRDDPLDTTPHGIVDLQKGMVVSCNAYFSRLAVQLGPRPLMDASALFQIDVARVPTPAGLEPTLQHAGYGQGEVLVSPLKMARVAASVASGGLVRPVRWESGIAGAPAQRFLSVEDAALLSRQMRDVVTSGTGRTLQSHATPIAGKTGTAEVGNGRAHSWFVGFAPFGGPPRIAFAVIVENAGYGARTAAPIAGEVVDAAREAGLFGPGARPSSPSRQALNGGSQ